MELVRGGHLFPIWFEKNGIRKVPALKGLPLGIIPNHEYETKEITLEPGEAILFITDGVTEAENERNELFGSRRLPQYIKTASGPPWGRKLLDEVKAWQGSAKITDDLTILEIWRQPDRV